MLPWNLRIAHRIHGRISRYLAVFIKCWPAAGALSGAATSADSQLLLGSSPGSQDSYGLTSNGSAAPLKAYGACCWPFMLMQCIFMKSIWPYLTTHASHPHGCNTAPYDLLPRFVKEMKTLHLQGQLV